MAQQDSVALNHFPRVVWRNSEKRLWNPIHRKALKNRPEERVRLRIIEYLIRGGWSKHRISTEEAINLPQKEAALRTDLICYTQAFDPFLLIECKAENIKLSEKTATQIARYNQRVEAPFLFMTNGQIDYWYALSKKQSVRRLDQIPEVFPDRSKPQTDFDYWKDRGFAGKRAVPALRLWLKEVLHKNLMQADTSSLRFLSFSTQLADIDLNHYYHIYRFDEHRLAFGFLATEFGGSRIITILNRKGHNEAVLEINLDLLFDDRTPNASIYWSGETNNEDARNFIDGLMEVPFDGSKVAENISSRLKKLVTS